MLRWLLAVAGDRLDGGPRATGGCDRAAAWMHSNSAGVIVSGAFYLVRAELTDLDRHTVGDVNTVGYQPFTRQGADLIDIALERSDTLELIVRESTSISAPLRQAMAAHGFSINPCLPNCR